MDSQNKNKNKIVVVGYALHPLNPYINTRYLHDSSAGVIGLTTAYLLSKDPNNAITVAAKHMPGDYDIEYCSPWAGANYMPCVAPSFFSFMLYVRGG